MKNKFIPGLVFIIFYMVSACGSETPDVGDDYCPETPNLVGTGGVISVGSTVISTAVSTSTVTNAETTSVGSGIELPQYDVPGLDEIATRLHSCHKFSYTQLGNFLKARGVATPLGNLTDTKTTMTLVFNQNITLSNIFGGSGNACEMSITDANGTNDPVCSGGEVCFCNQDDKQNQVNRSCLDVGNNSPDAADGYCVSKPATAGYLYFTGKDALGVPKLDARMAEKEEHTTASAMKLMDIFVQAAPQIITNISDSSKAPACTLNGKNKPMFAADGSCVEESVSCLIGTPATEDHMLLCNLLVSKADKSSLTDVIKKRNVAVAVLLSAAHSCQ